MKAKRYGMWSRLIVASRRVAVPDAGPALDAKRPTRTISAAHRIGEIRASERDWEVTKGTTSPVRVGSIASEMGYPRDVRFSPDSYQIADIAALRICAILGKLHHHYARIQFTTGTGLSSRSAWDDPIGCGPACAGPEDNGRRQTAQSGGRRLGSGRSRHAPPPRRYRMRERQGQSRRHRYNDLRPTSALPRLELLL